MRLRDIVNDYHFKIKNDKELDMHKNQVGTCKHLNRILETSRKANRIYKYLALQLEDEKE